RLLPRPSRGDPKGAVEFNSGCEPCQYQPRAYRNAGAIGPITGYGLLTQSQPVGDQREADESDEHDVEFFEAREDAAEALQAPEQTLYLVAPLVHLTVVLPGRDARRLGRNDGYEAQVERRLSGLVAFIGAVHDQVQRSIGSAEPAEQCTPFWRVAGLPRR